MRLTDGEKINVLILMECSGAMRLRFLAAGHRCHSVDIKPAEGDPTGHIVGDAFEALSDLAGWADMVIAHPVCTYLTGSAEWAYADPDFDRYPGVGYHQRVKAGTKTGAARRAARESATADVLRIWNCGVQRVAIENPVGVLSRHIGRPQVVQPWWFGDDASKKTCLWLKGLPALVPTCHVPPRMVSR